MTVSKIKERPTLLEGAQKIRGDLAHTSPVLGAERFKFIVESYKETEGQPTIVRRAKLFEKTLREKTIYIDENPIIGTVTEYRAGVYPYPEYACKWMRKEAVHRVGLGGIEADGLSEEERKWRDEAVEYWQDKCQWAKLNEVFPQIKGVSMIPLLKCGALLQGSPAYPLGFISIDYGKVLDKGVKGIIAEVKEELDKLSVGYLADYEKRHFYDAALICLNAVINYAHRHAALAKEMAEKEKDPERKKELERIIETCLWVPENRPRNFYEAIQSFWFTHCAAQVEENTWGIVPGRFSQYMYPYYKKDKEEGKIDDEEVIGLLAMLFAKCQELTVFNADLSFLGNSGQMAQHISIGGYTPDGEDATNELDFLLLETQKHMKCGQPSLTLLYHNKLSEEFLLKVVELIRTGTGQPQFMNLDVMIQRHITKYPGLTMKEARDSRNVGCVGSVPAHMCSGTYEGWIPMAKMLELALNNGRDTLTGFQAGPETGEAEEFKSYDDLFEAVREQFEYFLPLIRDYERLTLSINSEIIPLPFKSILIDDCIKKGKDIMNGGARYPAAGTWAITGVDLGNSLAAIKKLVFEEKKITMKQLKEALAADFEGYEEIYRMCVNAPKYGNDDEDVDQIVKQCYAMAWEIHQKAGPDWLGRYVIPEAFSASIHNEMGKLTGTLPSGRKARVALTDASVSAMPGTDENGPTAMVKSAAKAIDTINYGSNHLNMKFHPSALEGVEGARKLLALIKTYMDLGGSHIQFNCISSDVLKDAQLHPEEYRDLVVRVAGFSAFFIHLDQGVQDEIIKRSEIKFEN